jgi:hypothetical protein
LISFNLLINIIEIGCDVTCDMSGRESNAVALSWTGSTTPMQLKSITFQTLLARREVPDNEYINSALMIQSNVNAV